MKKIRCICSIILLSVLFVFTSCSSVKPLEFKRVNSFSIAENTNSSGITLLANLSLYNPNGFKFRVNTADIDVYAEGINLGKLKIPENIEIKPKEDFTGDFYIEISYAKLLMSGRNIISKIKKGKIELQLNGTIDTHFLWINKNFDVLYNEKVDLP